MALVAEEHTCTPLGSSTADWPPGGRQHGGFLAFPLWAGSQGVSGLLWWMRVWQATEGCQLTVERDEESRRALWCGLCVHRYTCSSSLS